MCAASMSTPASSAHQPPRHAVRHAIKFVEMFAEEQTPAHLRSGEKNLYREIAVALLGDEWRLPGLVRLLEKLSKRADSDNASS